MPGISTTRIGFGLAFVLAPALALSACQGSSATPVPSEPTALPTAAPSAAPESTGSGTAGPVSMTLLGNWQKVLLTEDALRTLITTLGPSNPSLAATLTKLLDTGQFHSFLLYALGYDGQTYLGNLNVTTFPVGALGLDGLAPFMAGQLENLGATGVTSTPVSLPAGDATMIAYTLNVKTGTTSVAVTGHLFLFVRDAQAYEVTFSCNGPDPSTCLGQGDEMIKTFRIGS